MGDSCCLVASTGQTTHPYIELFRCYQAPIWCPITPSLPFFRRWTAAKLPCWLGGLYVFVDNGNAGNYVALSSISSAIFMPWEFHVGLYFHFGQSQIRPNLKDGENERIFVPLTFRVKNAWFLSGWWPSVGESSTSSMLWDLQACHEAQSDLKPRLYDAGCLTVRRNNASARLAQRETSSYLVKHTIAR